MSEQGILIAADGQTIRGARNKIDSRRKTLILDLEADPKHMDIVEVVGGATYTDNGTPLTGRSQDLLYSMEHKLGFAPLVDCFFYVETVGGVTTDAAVGGYGAEIYFLSGGLGTLADVLSYEATRTEFKIVHNFDRYGFTTGYVSPAPRYKFKVKFYIYSIDIGREVNYGYGYDGTGLVIP